MNLKLKHPELEGAINRRRGAAGRSRYRQRFSWPMRAAIWTATLSTTGMYLTAMPARGEQLHRVIEASKRHVNWNRDLKPGTTDRLTPAQWKAVDERRAKEAAAKESKKPDVRVLSIKEMQQAKGSGPYRNAYFSGTLPWHRSLRDVNLCNGNLFKSFTDIQVAPGKGAGLALQRTYNSQDARPGPFGVGWTHAYDIRMEEETPSEATTGSGGGSVSGTIDSKLNYADRTDFFGAKHKYHRDADGLYSPPAYLFDETQSSYQQFLVNGPITPLDDTQTGMDGTVKHFTSVGSNWRACDYIQDRYGNRTTLAYGATAGGASVSNLLSTVTDPTGRQLVFHWSNLGTSAQPVYRIQSIDGPQYSVAYGYNADANLSSVTLDAGDNTHLNRTTSYGYTTYDDGNGGVETGLLASVTDPLGHSVSYSYSTTLPDSQQQQYPTPGNTAWVSSVSEPASGGTQVWNLSLQYISTGSDPTRFVTMFRNNAGGQDSLGYGIAVDGQLHKWRYNTAAGPNLIDSPTPTWQTDLDSSNNVTHTVHYSFYLPFNGNGYAQQTPGSEEALTYGPHGNQLTHTFTGETASDTTAYVNASQYFQKSGVTDTNGHTALFGIGSKYAGTTGNSDTNAGDRGSVLWVKDALYGDGTQNNTGTRFQYSYNAAGQKVSETNQNGTVTQYTYGDQWGNLTQVVQDPNLQGQTGHLNRVTTMTYDVAGHVLTSVDPNGNTSTFTYNVLGQPLSASFPAINNTPGETVSYTYDLNGRTLSVSDNRGTTTLAYEANSDRVSSVTDPVTGTTSYTYGLSGERRSMTLAGGGTWTYQYRSGITLAKDDPNSIALCLASLTDDQGRRIDINMDLFGHVLQTRSNQVFQNGSPVSYQFTSNVYPQWQNGRERLLQTSNSFYYKDANGNSQNKLLVSNAYTYDAAGQRLTNQISSLDPATAQPTSRTEQYGYDALNRLTGVDYGDGQTQQYAFDSMGNRTGKQDSAAGSESYSYNAANMLLSRAGNPYLNDANGNTLQGGGRTNVWDSQNRLVNCAYNGNTSQFTYGSDGLRHSSVVNGTRTDFVLDNSMFVREMNGASVKATYFMGASGPAYRRDDANGTLRWYVYDGLGSVLGEVDPSGNITARRKYDVYGATRSVTGQPTSKHAFVGQLGHASEDETGLVYMQHRYYDPSVGRFASEDPKEQGSNWLLYCDDNPVCRADVNGQFWQLLALIFDGAMMILGQGDDHNWFSPFGSKMYNMFDAGAAAFVNFMACVSTLAALQKATAAEKVDKFGMGSIYAAGVYGFIAAAMVGFFIYDFALMLIMGPSGWDKPGWDQDPASKQSGRGG